MFWDVWQHWNLRHFYFPEFILSHHKALLANPKVQTLQRDITDRVTDRPMTSPIPHPGFISWPSPCISIPHESFLPKKEKLNTNIYYMKRYNKEIHLEQVFLYLPQPFLGNVHFFAFRVILWGTFGGCLCVHRLKNNVREPVQKFFEHLVCNSICSWVNIPLYPE